MAAPDDPRTIYPRTIDIAIDIPSPDLAVVEAVLRLQLAARRAGGSIRLVEPCARMRELLDLMGLGLDLQVVGEAEGGEEVGVEEVVQPGDPSP